MYAWLFMAMYGYVRYVLLCIAMYQSLLVVIHHDHSYSFPSHQSSSLLNFFLIYTFYSTIMPRMSSLMQCNRSIFIIISLFINLALFIFFNPVIILLYPFEDVCEEFSPSAGLQLFSDNCFSEIPILCEMLMSIDIL